MKVCGTSVDKICTDYSWWTLDELWMVKAPAIVTIQSRPCMVDYILGVYSGPIAGYYYTGDFTR